MKLYLSLLWTHITPHRRKQFFCLFFLMVLASFAEVLTIGAVLPFLAVLTNPQKLFEQELIQPLIQFLNISEPQQLLLPLTITFSLAAIFSGAMRFCLLWAQTRLSFAIGADLSLSIYQRTLYQPYTKHVARNSSEIIAGVSQKANEVVHLTILPMLIIFSSSIMIFAILIMLFTINPTVAIFLFFGFGLIYIVIISITKKTVLKSSKIAAYQQNELIKALQEGLGGIRDILIDGSQEAYCQVFRSIDLSLRRSRANIQIIGGSPRFGIEALGMVLIAGLTFILARNNTGGFANTLPVLGAIALGAQRLLPAFQQSYFSCTLINGGQSQLRDALELLNQPFPEHKSKSQPRPIPFKNSIELEKIAFRYNRTKPWVLRDISLSIEKGSRVGFIGSTGSGKTTLIDIVMGLLPPNSGNLKVDGQLITAENHRAWQIHIAHVPQSIFLADATITENIAIGIPLNKINIKRVHDAARKAQISDTVESLKHKYNTRIGEQGVWLSGGQRQRIGIARALYKQADIIVFDEATSALDGETEEAVMKSINKINEKITVLFIAHRLTSLKGCSQIVEISNGKIKCIGTYQEIVQNKNRQ